MHKGIVMEITEKTLVLLTPDGEFREISRKNRNCRIGEEIVFTIPRSKWIQPKFLAGTAAAAALIVGLMLFSGATGVFANKEIVAYVSMDINPSVEMGIDAQRKVRDMQPLNDDGTVLLRSFAYKGKPVDQVTELLLAKAEANYLNKGQAEIVITSTLVNENAQLDDKALTEQLKQIVNQHVTKEHPQQLQSYDVEAFTAPAEVRKEAQQNGLSAGKYIVYLNAKSNGIDVPLADLKKDSVNNIAKDAGGINKLLGSGDKITKEEIRTLWKQEKEGSLDQKLKEQKDKKGEIKTGKEKAVTPRPVVNPTAPAIKTPLPTPRATFGNNDSRNGGDNRGAGNNRNGNDNINGNDNRNGNDGKNRGNDRKSGGDGGKSTASPTPGTDVKKGSDNKGEDGKNRGTVQPSDPKKPDDPKRSVSPQNNDRTRNSENGDRAQESRD